MSTNVNGSVKQTGPLTFVLSSSMTSNDNGNPGYMSERLQNCPSCGGLLHKHHMLCKDHTVSGQEFQLVKCEMCGLKFTNPRPTESEIQAYYQSEQYISHSDTRQGLINKLYGSVRKYTLGRKVNILNATQKPGSKDGRYLLDIGCGTGHFLHASKKAGWIVKGIETDEAARMKAIRYSGAEVKSDFLNDYTNEAFDTITMWHVLEHVHRLKETIQKLHSNLKPEGSLIVAVPNSDSWDAQEFKENWAAHDVPRHLYHFTQKTLNELLERHGFKRQATIPMPFDAYYISMLSTKNQTGRIQYLQSLIKGWRSNSWAEKNARNYSSLTYVFRKR